MNGADENLPTTCNIGLIPVARCGIDLMIFRGFRTIYKS